MSHLLAISIGPVQDFIAAARKTRDLRNGSQLLSDIATAVASDLESHGAELIFPATGGGSAPNKIVCLVEGDPAEAATKARAAADAAFAQAVDAAEKRIRDVSLTSCFDLGRLREQCGEFLEFYAAWYPLEADEYAVARARCESLLAGRKNLRDFTQPTWAGGRPKSSLDGGRDTVVSDCATDEQLGRLSIKKAEQLDGISVVKRLLDGGEARFPSVGRVASDPFWRTLCPRKLQEVTDRVSAYWQAKEGRDEQQHEDLVRRLEGAAKELYSDFPWDLDPNLWIVEQPEEELARLGADLRAILGRKQPEGYYTILQADGDRMGEVLSGLTVKEAHRKLSRQLACFAEQASGIVANHRGALVYAGGDDVLAFLPMDKVLGCAHELREAFDVVAQGLDLSNPPTLSIGIAVVHNHENLRTALEFARGAERAAKTGGRNALAIARHTRGMGADAPTVVRSWEQEPIDRYLRPYGQWAREGVLPSGFAYEIRALARELEGLNLADLDTLAEGEFRRILKRKQVPKDKVDGVVSLLTQDLHSLRGPYPKRLRTLSHSLIVAGELTPAAEEVTSGV